jgi:hypothetical protein
MIAASTFSLIFSSIVPPSPGVTGGWGLTLTHAPMNEP